MICCSGKNFVKLLSLCIPGTEERSGAAQPDLTAALKYQMQPQKSNQKAFDENGRRMAKTLISDSDFYASSRPETSKNYF